MSIDMSSAFDTISRETVLNVLEDAGCTSDEIRMVRLLLSNTVLKVKVNNTAILYQLSSKAQLEHFKEMHYQVIYLLLLKPLHLFTSDLYSPKYHQHLTQ